MLPFEGDVTFGTRPDTLPPGDYVVFLERKENAVAYASFDGKENGTFVVLGQNLELPDVFVHGSHRFVLADLSNTSTFYELGGRRAWQVGPSCVRRFVVHLSTDGRWIARECDEVQLEGVQGAHTVAEILSTEDGHGFRIAIHRIPSTSSNRPPYIHWLDATMLMVSDAWIEEGFATCAIAMPGTALYCPPIFRGKNAPSLGSTYPDSDIVALIYTEEYPWKSILVSKGCFQHAGACSGIIELSETDTVPVVTKHSGLVWWITPLEPNELTRIGVYEAPTWESRQIAEYGGLYSIMAKCPDGKCLFLEKVDSTLRYRLDLDGTLTLVPYQEIIGTFSIPEARKSGASV